ncbi:MAG TPA: DUF6159 family protein [Terriglobales bacterium]|nr:DUF6159 family protein [Terriglobales bacterium]
MFSRIERSWQLTKQCWSLLKQNKVLLIFPILSGCASLVIMISFFVPLVMANMKQLQHHQSQMPPSAYLLMFLFYFCLYLVQTFFNCALMGAANVAFAGGKSSLSVGLNLAWSRFGRIVIWSMVAATVGVILRTLEERAGLIGKIIISLLGAAWTILTYFMAPIIVFEDLGVQDGLSRSTAMIKKTWGEGVGKGLAFTAFSLLGLFVLVLGSVALLFVQPVAAALFFVVGFIALLTVISAMDGIFKVALYRYACWSMVPEGFSPELVQSAFAPKKKSRFGF